MLEGKEYEIGQEDQVQPTDSPSHSSTTEVHRRFHRESLSTKPCMSGISDCKAMKRVSFIVISVSAILVDMKVTVFYVPD